MAFGKDPSPRQDRSPSISDRGPSNLSQVSSRGSVGAGKKLASSPLPPGTTSAGKSQRKAKQSKRSSRADYEA